ncbi:hypothetical protein G4D61_15445 [Bacillus ginsengihumi]|uniref:Uncharacterized protein n=2 Tax=Heyndrickxia ginsengihumi TaxID=363870 RepID=A0A0A6VHK0_9BACI|nr:hypothetical protein [Heyndrickxia ginsengihumi]KHD86104.1 hypothetical protein NG54_04935 [Heyndrickxia ginsengihumi]NEY21339.1 hypothetical protein [Heyndrickxia ginsengihumi]
MKSSKIVLIAIFILSWLTLPLLGKQAFKKYVTAATFMCGLTKVLDVYGEKKKWWRFYKGIPPLDSFDIFNLGPYFITSLWMLKLTYGKLRIFLISNTLLHIVFIFGGLKYMKRFKILSLVKLTKVQYLVIDFIRAVILYAFQYNKEKLKTSSH